MTNIKLIIVTYSLYLGVGHLCMYDHIQPTTGRGMSTQFTALYMCQVAEVNILLYCTTKHWFPIVMRRQSIQ